MVPTSEIQNTIGLTRQKAKASDTMTVVTRSEAMLNRKRRLFR
jgi:hypothetical protein